MDKSHKTYFTFMSLSQITPFHNGRIRGLQTMKQFISGIVFTLLVFGLGYGTACHTLDKHTKQMLEQVAVAKDNEIPILPVIKGM